MEDYTSASGRLIRMIVSLVASAGAATFRETFAEALELPVNTYFSCSQSGAVRLYKRISAAPGYRDLGDTAANLFAETAKTYRDQSLEATSEAAAHAMSSSSYAAVAAALLDGMLFTTDAAGVAAVDDGAPFVLQGDGEDGVFGRLKRRVGAAAVDQGISLPALPLPASALSETDEAKVLTAAERLSIVAASSAMGVETTGRPEITNETLNACDGGTYVFSDPAEHTAVRHTLRTRNAGTVAKTIQLCSFTMSGGNFQPAPDAEYIPLVIPPGVHEQPIALLVRKGEQSGFAAATTGVSYATGSVGDSGGYYYNAAVAPTSPVAAGTKNTTVRLDIGIDCTFALAGDDAIAELQPSIAAAAATAESAVDGLAETDAKLSGITETAVVDGFSQTAATYAGFVTGTPSCKGWAPGFLGTSLPEGALIEGVEVTLHRGATVATFEARLFSRPIATTTVPSVADTAEWDGWVSVDASGVAVGTFGPVAFSGPAIAQNDQAKAYYCHIQAKDSGGNLVDMGLGNTGNGTGLNQVQRGYYRNGGNSGWDMVGSTIALNITVKTNKVQVKQDAFPPVEDVTIYADALMTPYVDVLVDGAVVSVDGLFRRNGSTTAINADVTLPLAASGQERVDHIVYNRSTGVVSAVAGAARTANLDAIEWQAAVPANSIILARALVGSADVKAVNTAEFRGLIKVGHEGEIASLIQRNRALFAPILAMASRAAPVKWLGTGDSLCAMQESSDKPATLVDQYLPNGIWRDRRNSYFASYPSDTRALIPTFDFGDGETDHIRLGENWAIKAALDKIAGAPVVTYYNTGIASSTSANTLVGSIPNLLYPARLAADLTLNADVAALMIGMNDRSSGTPPITYLNVCAWIDAHLGNSAKAVVIYGCPRPNKAESVSQWRAVNEGLEAAALDKGVIWVPTTTISDDRNLGGIGVPAETLCSANEITAGRNHRGYLEILRYEQNALMMLGL